MSAQARKPDSADGFLDETIKLKLRKPKNWNWSLSTSKSSPHISIPTIQLFNSKGLLLVETKDDAQLHKTWSSQDISPQTSDPVKQDQKEIEQVVNGNVRNGEIRSRSTGLLSNTRVSSDYIKRPTKSLSTPYKDQYLTYCNNFKNRTRDLRSKSYTTTSFSRPRLERSKSAVLQRYCDRKDEIKSGNKSRLMYYEKPDIDEIKRKIKENSEKKKTIKKSRSEILPKANEDFRNIKKNFNTRATLPHSLQFTEKRLQSNDPFQRKMKYVEASAKRASEDGYSRFITPHLFNSKSMHNLICRKNTVPSKSDPKMDQDSSESDRWTIRTSFAGTLIVPEEEAPENAPRRRRGDRRSDPVRSATITNFLQNNDNLKETAIPSVDRQQENHVKSNSSVRQTRFANNSHEGKRKRSRSHQRYRSDPGEIHKPNLYGESSEEDERHLLEIIQRRILRETLIDEFTKLGQNLLKDDSANLRNKNNRKKRAYCRHISDSIVAMTSPDDTTSILDKLKANYYKIINNNLPTQKLNKNMTIELENQNDNKANVESKAKTSLNESKSSETESEFNEEYSSQEEINENDIVKQETKSETKSETKINEEQDNLIEMRNVYEENEKDDQEHEVVEEIETETEEETDSKESESVKQIEPQQELSENEIENYTESDIEHSNKEEKDNEANVTKEMKPNVLNAEESDKSLSEEDCTKEEIEYEVEVDENGKEIPNETKISIAQNEGSNKETIKEEQEYEDDEETEYEIEEIIEEYETETETETDEEQLQEQSQEKSMIIKEDNVLHESQENDTDSECSSSGSGNDSESESDEETSEPRKSIKRADDGINVSSVEKSDENSNYIVRQFSVAENVDDESSKTCQKDALEKKNEHRILGQKQDGDLKEVKSTEGDAKVGPVVCWSIHNLLWKWMTDMPSWSRNFLSKATPKTVVSCILSGIWLDYLWETYLCFRQFKLTQNSKQLPRHLADLTSPEFYTLSRMYHLDQMKLGFAKDLFTVGVSTAIIRHGILGKIWAIAEKVTPLRGEIGITWMWSALFTMGTTFLYLPFSLYETFVLENRYGFNNLSLNVFISDVIITLIFVILFNLPAYAAFISLVKLSGNKLVFILWFISTVAIVGLTATLPSLMDPSDGSFTSLPEGKLKDDIEDLARIVGFPLDGIFIKDSSQRNNHPNAYFAGMFGMKRIVLYDTLLTICTPNEILAILCHEFGHWKHKHVISRMIVVQLYLLLTICLYSWTYKWPPFYQAMGFQAGVEPVLVGLTVLTSLAMVPINSVVNCLLNCLTRRQEYEADQFTVQFGRAKDLIEALKKIHRGNLSDLVCDPLFVAWYHSHPPISDRIDALRNK